MIQVNIQTLEASREDIPANIARLDDSTLNNLQTELNPVPDDLIDIEYWAETSQLTPYDTETEKLGNEILTPDVPNKTVIVTHEVVTLTAQEITTNLDSAKAIRIAEIVAKTKEVSTEDLTVGGVIFTTDNESIADITSALSLMGRSPTETIDFKGVNGWSNANKAGFTSLST